MVDLNLTRLFWQDYGLHYPDEVRERWPEQKVRDAVELAVQEQNALKMEQQQQSAGGSQSSQATQMAFDNLPRVTR